jgi:hypothetical protein
MNLMRWIPGLFMAALVAAFARGQAPSARVPTVVSVLRDVPIDWVKTAPESFERDGLTVLRRGQAVQTTVDLPPAPANLRDARRIIARLIVAPAAVEHDGKLRPGDPWTRLGNVCLVLPTSATQPAKKKTSEPESPDTGQQVELMRFITGFGGYGEFTQDVTAFAPLLHDRVTLRVFISTYASPAWNVSLTLEYDADGAGQRRPAWAAPLFNEAEVTAEKNVLKCGVSVPKGIEQPRIFITSTGHATDGSGGDEFITRTHILRIDGVEVARWRPWSESGGESRASSPTSDRQTIDGRVLWSSDFDRSGWTPGSVVEPLRLPVPELTPGKHSVEIEIVGIRPPDAQTNHGYWRTSAIVVADEPWPPGPTEPRESPSP